MNSRLIKISIVTLLSLLAANNAEANFKGRIAVFQNNEPIAVDVELPAFSGGLFQNDQFHFANLPKNMTPDENGCFCYSMGDERFAFVHSFYYAINQIEDYNQIFSKLDLPRPKSMELTLERDVDSPTSGFMGMAQGTVTYPRPALDISTLSHEISHWLHYNAAGRRIFGSTIGALSKERAEQKGIEEGAANLLAALHTGVTQIGKYDGYDFFYDIDNFVRIPDLILTSRQTMENVLQSSRFITHYPKFAENVRQTLKQAESIPLYAEYLNLPEPYTSSSVIGQPIWKASMRFGVETIKLLYVKSISELREDKAYSYSDLSKKLIEVAGRINPNLGKYLKQEYQMRGLN